MGGYTVDYVSFVAGWLFGILFVFACVVVVCPSWWYESDRRRLEQACRYGPDTARHDVDGT